MTRERVRVSDKTESLLAVKPNEGSELQAADPCMQRTNVGIIDWLCYLPFVLGFIGTLCFFDILQRICFLFSRGCHEKAVDYLNRSLVALLNFVFVKVQVEYKAPVSSQLPCLVVANHQSLYDIPIIHNVFRGHRPKFVAKRELARWIPSVSFNLRKGGGAVIDRDNPRQAVRALREFAERLRDDPFTAVVFPEGTRARDGRIKNFRSLGVQTITKVLPDMRIVPVTIDGSSSLYPYRWGPIPIRQVIRVTVHPSIVSSDFESTDALLAAIFRTVADSLPGNAGQADVGDGS